MAASIVSILATVLAIVLWGLKKYSEDKAKRREDEIQKGRDALLRGDTSAVESRIDGVCSQVDSHAGIKSDDDIARELSAVYGVAVDSTGNSKDSGTSGKVSKPE